MEPKPPHDLISKLPSDVIGHILSLMPTKEAVRTSVLCKKWRYYWKSVTSLHFEDTQVGDSSKKKKSDQEKKDFFIHSIYRVLLSLNHSTLESFSLSLTQEYDPIHPHEWVLRALERYQFLEELVLNVIRCTIRVPSHAMFSSLTVLKLHGLSLIASGPNPPDRVVLEFPVLSESRSSGQAYPTLQFCVVGIEQFSYRGLLLPEATNFDLSAATEICEAEIVISPNLEEAEDFHETQRLIYNLFENLKRVRVLEFEMIRK
ncbi:hypothetical protein OROGR_013602 [Orobanche gracilis]